MKRDEKALVDLFNTLDKDLQQSLFDYAEFLQSKANAGSRQISDPIDIPRPDNETVVGAIKRMKQAYPMIDSMEVFAVASNLMTDHMVKGRDAEEVINEIEVLFEDTYRQILREFE
jgi:hypothetical protein